MHELKKETFILDKKTFWKFEVLNGHHQVNNAVVITLEPQVMNLIQKGLDIYLQMYEDSGTHVPVGNPIIIEGVTQRWSTYQVKKRLQIVSCLVEIGVSYGNNAWRMCAFLEPTECHLVDPYTDVPESVLNKELVDPELPFQLAQNLLNYFPVKFHKQKSEEAYKNFEDGYFDFIYIDGDHSYDGCKKDIELWFPKLRVGGIMAGDDYHKDGVKPAVESCFKNYEVSPNGYEWLIVKNEVES